MQLVLSEAESLQHYISKFGLLGSLLGLAVTAGGVYFIFKRQDKYGLYDKTKNFNQIFIFQKDLTTKNFYNIYKKNKHLIFLYRIRLRERFQLGF